MVAGLVLVALATLVAVIQIASAASDPPSTYSGTRLTVQQAAQYAYAAGFHTEQQVLAVVSIGIVESGLYTQARNWHPEFGYRPASAVIDVQGPASVWSGGRQMQSDRGAWQISSKWWPQYTDAQTDNPATAAKLMYAISSSGTDFDQWDTYKSGEAQQYFDGAHGGWPALRPIVDAVVAARGAGLAATPAVKAAAKPAAKPAATPAAKPAVKAAAAKPQVAPAASSGVPMSGTYVTSYGYYDNNPPGSAAISNPVIHRQAGGTGTYADPITVAVADGSNDGLQFAPGTRFYIPNLRAYFMAEDSIGDGSGGQVHLDVWSGGQSSSESSAINCEDHITGDYLVIRNPANNYAVVPGPLAANNTCRQNYGNALVKSGGAAAPVPTVKPAPAPKPPVTSAHKPATLTASSPPSSNTNGGDSGHRSRHHHHRHHARWSDSARCLH